MMTWFIFILQDLNRMSFKFDIYGMIVEKVALAMKT
jgi:hypothetical protein